MGASQITTLDRDGFQGYFYEPELGSDRCMIVLIGDAGNGLLDRACAKWLLDGPHCSALCLAARQDKNQDAGVRDWPLEYIEKAALWLRKEGFCKIGVLGMSIQAAMALSAACRIPDITLAVALTPCDFVPWGFCQGRVRGEKREWPSGGSSFTWRGQPLPFQPAGLDRDAYWRLYKEEKKKYGEMHTVTLFDLSEQFHPVEEEARIPVEQIAGRILLCGAQDDAMWNAVRSIRRMAKRLQDRDFPHPVDLLLYPYGTHLLMPEGMAKKLLPFFPSLASRLFVSGRRHAAACRQARQDLDQRLTAAIRSW